MGSHGKWLLAGGLVSCWNEGLDCMLQTRKGKASVYSNHHWSLTLKPVLNLGASRSNFQIIYSRDDINPCRRFTRLRGLGFNFHLNCSD